MGESPLTSVTPISFIDCGLDANPNSYSNRSGSFSSAYSSSSSFGFLASSSAFSTIFLIAIEIFALISFFCIISSSWHCSFVLRFVDSSVAANLASLSLCSSNATFYSSASALFLSASSMAANLFIIDLASFPFALEPYAAALARFSASSITYLLSSKRYFYVTQSN